MVSSISSKEYQLIIRLSIFSPLFSTPCPLPFALRITHHASRFTLHASRITLHALVYHYLSSSDRNSLTCLIFLVDQIIYCFHDI
jgi:hypothetical protein